MTPRRTAQLVDDAAARLGEGPMWDVNGGRLLWVDVLSPVVRSFHPATGPAEHALERPLTLLAATRDGRFVGASGGGIGLVELEAGRVERAVVIEGNERCRLNDGNVDARGRLWIGSMAVDSTPRLGSLYRLDSDGVARILTEISISNGIDWSPDGKRLYYVDSGPRTIEAFDYDAESGSIRARRLVASFPSSAGLPDGLSVDAEGSLWVAFWGGGCVLHLTPAGRILDRYRLPVSLVTSCAFGGDDLDELFVTTASTDGVKATGEPGSGGLFRFSTPAVGRLPNALHCPMGSE